MTLSSSFSIATPDDYVNTTSTTGIIVVNGSFISGTIEKVGDVDMFKIALVANVSYNFYCERVGSQSVSGLDDPEIFILSSSLVVKAYDDDSGIPNPNNEPNNAQISNFISPTTGNYYLRVKDYATGTGAYKVWAISVGGADITPPSALSFSPIDAATDTPINANIVVTFNEPIQRGTGSIIIRLGTSSGTIIETFDVATSTNISISGSVLTINPTSEFANSNHYFVTFASGTIKDLSNNIWTGTSNYDFFTVAAADILAPTVIVSSNVSSLKAGDTATITFTLSEISNTFYNTSVICTGGTLSNFIGSTTVYTATFTPDINSTTNGAISVASGTFSDTAGNFNIDGADINNSVTLAIDTVLPTIIVTSDVTSLKAGETALITFTLSEASTDFTVASIATVSGGSLSLFNKVNDSLYTAIFTPLAGSTVDGVIVVENTKFTDASGNKNADGSQANNIVILSIDTQTPNLLTFSPGDGITSVNITSDIILTFSENIQRGDGSILIRMGSSSGTIIETINIATATNITISGSTLTINPTADLAYSTNYYVTFASGTIKDMAGNTWAGISTYDFTTASAPDIISPTIIVSSNKTILLAGQTATITFTLSEVSTDFILADITVTGGTLSNFAGSNMVYTATFTPTTSSTTNGVISVASNKFTDPTGNFNIDGADTNNKVTITIDTIIPRPLMFSPVDGDSQVDRASNIVIVFSETIQKGTGTITIRDGSPTGSIIETINILPSPSTSSPNVSITGTILTINPTVDFGFFTNYYIVFTAGSIKDLKGNPCDAINTYDFYSIGDYIEPNIIISADKISVKKGQTSLVTFTLSEPSTDFTINSITVTGGTLSPLTPVTGGKIYTSIFTPDLNSLNNGIINVSNSQFTDSAGNSNIDGEDIDNTVIFSIDTIPPTVTSISTNFVSTSGKMKAGDTATITFVLSEYSTNFTIDDTIVTGGTLSNFSGNGVTYTAIFTPSTDSVSNCVIRVSANTFTDEIGNPYEGSYSFQMSVDTVIPTIAISSSRMTMSPVQTATITFTLSENSTDFVLGDIDVTGGTLSALSGSGKVYTSVFTPIGGSTSGVISVASNKFKDAASNFNIDGNEPDNVIAITIGSLPTIALSTSASPLRANQTATISFVLSESSTDFVLGDIDVTGGTLSALLGSDTNYTSVFTPTANSTTPGIVSVTSNKFSNSLAYFNADGLDANNSVTMIIDSTPPTIIVTSSTASLSTGQTALITFTISEPIVAITNGGIIINLIYSPAAMAAPASFRSGVEEAATIISNQISDKISVNITVGYSGEGAGASGGPSFGQYRNYEIVRNYLISNETPGDISFDSMPNTSSIQGRTSVAVWYAQLKLFGQLAAYNPSTDGIVNFNTGIPPAQLVSVALHELTHAMGRINGVTGISGNPGIFDLFRYTAPGVLLFSPGAPSAAAYFSIDGGITHLADYGLSSDPADFLNAGIQGPNDAFNEYYSSTTAQIFSDVDRRQMLVLGYHLASNSLSSSLDASIFELNDIIRTGGTLSNFTGSGTSYTATFTPYLNSTISAVVSVPSSAFSDATGNYNVDGADANNSVTMSVSTLVPPQSILFEPNDESIDVAINAQIKVIFKDPIKRGTGNIKIRIGSATGTVVETINVATATLPSLFFDIVPVDLATPAANSVVITPSANLGNGVYYITFDSGTIKSDADIPWTGTSTYNFTTVVALDDIPPSTTTFDPVNNSTNVAIDKNIIVTFEEPVKRGSGTIEIHIDSYNGTLVESINTATATNISISGSVLTINPQFDFAYDTTYYVTFSNGSIKDLYNNNFPSFITYHFHTRVSSDNTAPTIAISSNVYALKIGETATITFTLSEQSTNFTISSVTCAGGNLTGFANSGDNIHYTATFTPFSYSALNGVINVAGGKFNDIAGNLNVDGADANNTVTISVDTIRPSIAITTNLMQLGIGQTATITFTLSEASSNFNYGCVTVSGGALSNPLTVLSNRIYTGVFTPDANSVINGIISVSSNKFSDLAGNYNADAADPNNTLRIFIDTIRPTVAITSSSLSLGYAQTATITFTLSEESVTFNTNSTTVTGGTLSALSTSNNIIYTGVFTPNINSDVNGVISVASNKFNDMFGNSNIDGADTNNTVTIAVDTKDPTISITSSSLDLATGQTATITFTLSEASSNFNYGSITVSGGTLSNPLTVVNSTTYTAIFTPSFLSPQGVITVSNDAFSDIWNNFNSDGLDSNNTITIDTLNIDVLSFSPIDEELAVDKSNNIVLVFNKSIQRGTGNIYFRYGPGTDRNIANSDGTTGTNFVFAASSTYITIMGNTFTLNPPWNLNYSTLYYVTFDSGVIKDLSGHGWAGTSTYNFTTGVAPDIVGPQVNISSAINVLRIGLTSLITFTLSEPSSDFALADITRTGGTLTNFNAISSTVYTATFTPDANSTVNGVISVAAGTFHDAAGNANIQSGWGAFTLTIQIDTIAPTAVTFSPAQAAVSANVASNIVITFSEAIQRGTAGLYIRIRAISAAGTIKEEYISATSTNLSISGSTLTINPTNNLDYSTRYYVTLEAGSIVDSVANIYAGTSAYYFDTSVSPDLIAPLVSTYNPAYGLSTVSLTSNIVITFNESVKMGTGNILIRSVSNTGTILETIPVPDARLTISGAALTINPTATFAYNTTYFVILPAGCIKDLYNNDYAGTSSYQFTTTYDPAVGPANTNLGGQAIVGFGSGGAASANNVTRNAYMSIGTYNKITSSGIIGADITFAVAKSALAGCGYGSDKAIFAYGIVQYSRLNPAPAIVYIVTSNKVSNTGVIATDVAASGQGRYAVAGATYGLDKGIFAYGFLYNSAHSYLDYSGINLITNTGVIGSDTNIATGSGRSHAGGSSYGIDKAVFFGGYYGNQISKVSKYSNVGVLVADVSLGGTGWARMNGASYGVDKAIFYGGTSSVGTFSYWQKVSELGYTINGVYSAGEYWGSYETVLPEYGTTEGTAFWNCTKTGNKSWDMNAGNYPRDGCAAATFDGNKAIFVGGMTSSQALSRASNIFSNTGVLAKSVCNLITARSDANGASYG